MQSRLPTDGLIVTANLKTANEMQAFNIVSLFGAVTLVGGLYLCWQAWFAFASRFWPTTQGRVLTGGLYSAPGFPPAYSAQVHYEYSINGIRYESKRLRFGGVNPFSYRAAESELTVMIRTGKLSVHYDPARPERSCLIIGSNEWTIAAPAILLIFGALVLAIGVYGHSS